MITLDSNIFVYVSDDRFQLKQRIAQRVVESLAFRRCMIAMQVVGETQNVLVRKLKLPPEEAVDFGWHMLRSFELASPARADAAVALTEMAAGRLSYWDALLVSTMGRAGCTALLTEDMQDGATLLGVEIVNPFGRDGLSERAAELLAA